MVIDDIRVINCFRSSESVDEFMGTYEIEFIDRSLLLKDTSVEIVDIKLPVVRTFESVDFQRRVFGILLEEGYLFTKLPSYLFWEFVILEQEVPLYGDETTQSLFSSSSINSSTLYRFPCPVLNFFSAFLTFSWTFSVQNQA